METKFRPIPVTILDLLAILLPGFVWLVLLTTTFQILLPGGTATSPVPVWEGVGALMKGLDSWFAVLTIVFASLLIGYIIKPWAMTISNVLGKPFFILTRYGWPPWKKTKFPYRRLNFPYKAIHGDSYSYKKLIQLLRVKIDCDPESLSGSAPFSVAKRYLRLTAPALWEECERMEAEVRMTATLFLASLYSVVVSFLTLAFKYRSLQTLSWLVLSIVALLLLGRSVNVLRVREVSYTYLNAIIAIKCLPQDQPNASTASAEVNTEA
jgi:hypothetical protein